ncbi:hypothetical protein GCM10009087_26360 [Sphingomonas oligophenolica]|uniref:Uncharacterized protein n=2 Tax=Sphingomonas oligophenolica TaxID=301154 RepID=A0ABU9Y804_9SPHN
MRMILTALAIAAVAAPGGARDRSQIPEAIAAGKPENCIRTISIRETHVRSDSVIDFDMVGGKVYRNTLPQACPELGFEEKFLYKTSIGQLCSVDTITVLHDGPGGAGPTCGLGVFQPVTLVKAPKHP